MPKIAKDPHGSPTNYYADLLEPTDGNGYFVEDPVDVLNSLLVVGEDQEEDQFDETKE